MARDVGGWWFSDQKRVDETSRWHRCQEGRLKTPDRVGDCLAQWLWESSRSAPRASSLHMGENEDPFVYTISKQLLTYENETRPLFRLARTGYVLRVIEGLYRDASAELRGKTKEDRDWVNVLKRERSERHKFLSLYLVRLGECQLDKLDPYVKDQLIALSVECGDEVGEEVKIDWNKDDTLELLTEDDALELLTLMKNDFELFGEIVYTEEEKHLLKLAFSLIAAAANTTILNLPRLFVDPIETSEVENPGKHPGCKRWFGVHVEVIVHPRATAFIEEKVIRQMSVMEDLYHPHLRQLYGAWHIGQNPSFLWERVWPNKKLSGRDDKLQQSLEGFQYLHMKGLYYEDQLDFENTMRFSSWDRKLVLDCQGLVHISSRTSDTDELLRGHEQQIKRLQHLVGIKESNFINSPNSKESSVDEEGSKGGDQSNDRPKESWQIDPTALFTDSESDRQRLFKVCSEINDSDRGYEDVANSSVSSDFFSLSCADSGTGSNIFTPGGTTMNGGFGLVSYARWHDARVAVKVLKLEVASHDLEKDFLREVDLWYKLSHPNVVKLFGANSVIVDKVERYFFVCEPATEQSLDKVTKKTPKEKCTAENKELALWALYQAALGLQYLHSRGIIHGDLKGNNILVFTSPDRTRSGTSSGPSRLKVRDGVIVKLADFGLSYNASGTPHNITGAKRWVAPEVLVNKQCASFASDIYALGMCILEALSGELPWQGIDDDIVVEVYAKRGALPRTPEAKNEHGQLLVTVEEKQLIEKMCQKEPAERISIFAVVNKLYELADKQTKLAAKSFSHPQARLRIGPNKKSPRLPSSYS